MVDDGGSRRDSVGTVSLGSVDSDGGSPTHGNGGLVPRNESRRPSLVEVPQGIVYCLYTLIVQYSFA